MNKAPCGRTMTLIHAAANFAAFFAFRGLSINLHIGVAEVPFCNRQRDTPPEPLSDLVKQNPLKQIFSPQSG